MAHRGDAEALRFGDFVQLDELGRANIGRCVRVLGRIGRVDTSSRMNEEVRVRDEARTGILVRARLVISIDRVDCELYDRCLALRRRL